MKKLTIHTIGVQGKSAKAIKRAYARIETEDNNSIMVDAYQGQGETYSERKEEEIQILFSDGTQWTGTFKRLNERLSK